LVLPPVDTLIICDGGRADPLGFDAAYIALNGIPIIGYSIRCGVESRHIRKIYVYSDLTEKLKKVVEDLYPDQKGLAILGPDDPVKKTRDKILRIVPSEKKLVMSISKTFYRYVLRDSNRFPTFTGDWKNMGDIREYLLKNPDVGNFPVAFMANDQPLCRASDLDKLIAVYDGSKYDTLIGYTLWDVLKGFLYEHGLKVNDFCHTLKKQDFYDGKWMRHNCLYVVKWAKTDERLSRVISFYHRHRVQSRIENFISVLIQIVSAYHKNYREILKFLFLGALFGIGKYFKNFGNNHVHHYVKQHLNNDQLIDITHRLIDHRLSVFYDCGPGPVIDIDDPKDIVTMRKLIARVD
jgi:hypothetical protein